MDPQAPGGEVAPAEPAAPVTPPAAELAAPVAAPAPAPAPTEPAAPAATPTLDEQAAEAEANEWDEAADEIFPGLKSAKKPEEGKKPDEPAKPAEKPKTPEAPAAPEAKAPDGTEPEVPADEAAAGDDEEAGEPDPSRFDTRRQARERQQEVDALKTDVRKQMFAEAPTELRDADGDPIKSIEDVMRLVNPRTGQQFTEEEAGIWLLSAQQQFNQRVADMDRQIDQIANLHADLHDQVGSINYRYGELLKAMPDVRDKLWTQYQNTLVKDEKSGVIINAPVSLEEFYETALEPYAKMARDTEPKVDPATPPAPVETPEQKAEREKKEKDEADAKKKKERADRSDIYGGGDKDPVDPEDKEWGDAATAVFGPRK